jgi:predicted 3-demethylubiquinone-9 3-methyltransferase (glyoxalase superfamily)
MSIVKHRIAPCLWFDTQAEDAAKFYVSVFKNSKIGRISHYGKAGHEVHGRPAGSVMSVEFELDGQTIVGLNGGPHFKFTEAISLQVYCESQDEVDYFWRALTDGGEEGPCGWLKDKYGLSWQVVPTALLEMMLDPDTEKSERVMNAFLKMKKFDIAALKQAFAGQG